MLLYRNIRLHLCPNQYIITMNRTIKFRGKRVDKNAWVYGSLLVHSGRVEILVAYSENILDYDIHVVHPETVGQFTGLLDKDGKEIYEGDFTHHDAHDVNCLIKWIDKYACFAGEQIGYVETLAFYQFIDQHNLVVIGNIHDNQELINQ